MLESGQGAVRETLISEHRRWIVKHYRSTKQAASLPPATALVLPVAGGHSHYTQACSLTVWRAGGPRQVLAGRQFLWASEASSAAGRRPHSSLLAPSSHHLSLLLPSSWLLLLCLICRSLIRTSVSLGQCPHLKLLKLSTSALFVLPCQVTLAIPGMKNKVILGAGRCLSEHQYLLQM